MMSKSVTSSLLYQVFQWSSPSKCLITTSSPTSKSTWPTRNSVISCTIYLIPWHGHPPGSPSRSLAVFLSHSHSLFNHSPRPVVLPSDSKLLTIFHNVVSHHLPRSLPFIFPSFLQAAEDYSSWEVLIC